VLDRFESAFSSHERLLFLLSIWQPCDDLCKKYGLSLAVGKSSHIYLVPNVHAKYQVLMSVKLYVLQNKVHSDLQPLPQVPFYIPMASGLVNKSPGFQTLPASFRRVNFHDSNKAL